MLNLIAYIIIPAYTILFEDKVNNFFKENENRIRFP